MAGQRFWIAILAVVAVGLIAFAARSLFSSVRSDSETIALVKPLMCASCGHRYDGEISRPPAKCPKCTQAAVWPALRCANCGTVLACDRRKFRNEGRDPYCPKCNSAQLTSVQDGR
jgi:predicted Zn-ribbon and HTH transcriptional regulator